MYSLRHRLLISATLLLLVFLGVMSIGLNRAFESSVLSNAEDALRNQILLLMANIDVVDGQIVVPKTFSEPRLSQIDSNLFALIYIGGNDVFWRSPSLLDESLPLLDSELGRFNFFNSVEWTGNSLVYGMTLGVEWETEQGDLPFTVQVVERTGVYTKRLVRYQRQVGLWLLVLGGSLVALLLLLLGWALTPLHRVTRQVAEIEEGARQRFDEDYPLEVSRLTQNLNQLLNFEEKRITRHKEVLANLAHSLKTPIAILSGLKYSEKNKHEVNDQLMSMQKTIDYQLQSASAVGRRRFVKPIDIYKPTEKIIGSLSKLHFEKGLSHHINVKQGVRFYGDEGDWVELAGNLLDNAFKWAHTHVAITVTNQSLEGTDSRRMATILEIEDDGSGIDGALKNIILNRGVRLDSQTPGHGLGLHIVKGIVEAYDGEIEIKDAKQGGTIFTVRLN